ncbi:hypothetical protein FDECE_608 [Fusarium decemcellulare]|nr:hypothetical protein FDECE_608 [Fusarium decemcellulare]
MATTTSPPTPTHAQSLWDRAFDSLNGDLKLALNQATTRKRDILAAVLEAAEDKRATCLRRSWKVKRSNGEVVVIRDLLEKIAKWVDRFKAVGDVASQFDAGSASLPWAAVRFLLQITVNDAQQFASLVQDLEVLSRIIARYKEFEKLHLSRNSPMQPGLETALTVLYTEVLTHLARTIEYFSKSTPVRIAQSVLYAGDKNSIQAILSQEDEVWKLANLQDTEDLRFLTTTVLRLRDQATTKLLDEESYMNMVLGLSSSPFPIHHQTISQSRTPDFGQWLLKLESYRQWCETSSSSILWLHGIMGSGKTYLFSVVVDSLLATAATHQNSAPFAYFYCLSTESEPERSSADEILRSALRQLAMTQTHNGVRDTLASEFELRSKSARLRGLDLPKLTRKKCVDLIIEVANEDPIVILLDAVDQIQDEHRYALLKCLDRIISEAANVVKVFVTSRNDNEVFSALPTAKEIMITRDNTHNDMAQFILQKIDDARLIFGNLSSETRDSLANALLVGAGEMFLWARHQIQQLRKVKREEDLLPALEANVLSDLDKLYENDLRQILDAGKASCQLAIQVFSWLLYMKTPLTPTALLTAIKTTSTDLVTLTLADVSALCSNLVIVDVSCDTIRFAHQSMQEYLLRTNQTLFSSATAHSLLASTCIKVNSRGPPSSQDLESQAKDFYFYAATHWAAHFTSAKAFRPEEQLFQEMLSFVFEDEGSDVSLSFEVWLNICKRIVSLLPRDHPMKVVLDAVPNDESSPLFLAAVFGIDGLLRLLAEPDRETDWNQRNGRGHTALYLAAAFGHISSILILAEKGAEVNIECGAFGSPLHAACFKGHEEAVGKLLSLGASPTCGARFENALDAAFYGGHENVVLLLVKDGSSLKSETDHERGLQMAAEYGFSQVINELRRSPLASIRAKETLNRQKERMAKAIKGGQQHVIRYQLLGNVLDPLTRLPRDAVAIAAFYGHTDVAGFLLSMGMGIEVEGQFGSPLRSASLMNRKSTVRLLLQRGADIKTGELKGNALYVAAVKGHVDIAGMLIAEGTDVNQKTGSLGTVLQAASYYGHKSIVRMLLDAGADVHMGGASRDAFHAAAEGGHQEIIMLLLERGYKFRDPPSYPLANMGPAPAYRQLFRESSPRRNNHPDARRRSSCSTMSWENDDPLIKTEADETLDVPHEEASGRHRKPHSVYSEYCPLETSALAGQEEVVKFLLCHKGSLGISDAEVTRAMASATSNGHLKTAKILLDYMPIMKCISLILDPTRRCDQMMVELALGKASESDYTADEIHTIRLKLPPGPEKYKVPFIEAECLRSDFLACCTAGDSEGLLSILDCKHCNLLRPKDFARGLSLAAGKGFTSILTLLFNHFSFPRDLIIPDKALISAAGCSLSTFKLLVSRREGLVWSADVLGRATFSACHKGHPEVLEFLISRLGIDVNINVPEIQNRGFAFRLPRRLRKGSTSSSGDSLPDDNIPRFASYFRRPFPSDDSSSKPLFDKSATELLFSEENYVQGPLVKPRLSRNTGLISPLQAALCGLQHISRPRAGERKPLHQQVIGLLLRHGADPNSLGGQEGYPIQIAAKSCPDSVVKELIDAGACVELVCKGDSAFSGAVQRELEPLTITRRLLKAGQTLPSDWNEGKQIIEMALAFFDGGTRLAYPNRILDDPDGRFLHAPSLKYVFEEGPGAVLELLLRHYEGEILEDTRYSMVLQMSCFLGKKDLVQLLLARGVDLNGIGYYYGCALQAAARNGQTEIVKLLLEGGADVNILQGRWHTPLRAAIAGSYGDIVHLLLEHNADVKLKYKTENLDMRDEGRIPASSLQLALQGNNMDICRALLAADLTLIGDETYLPHPLIMACQKGYTDMARILLHMNAPINVQGPKTKHWPIVRVEDASPLHAAVAGGYVPLVELLLCRGADVNMDIKDTACTAPLLVAVGKGDRHIVRRLLGAGANVNHISGSETPLSRAVGSGQSIALVKDLISAGATVVGSHPHPNCLGVACCKQNFDIIELLLETLCTTNENPGAFIDEVLEAVSQKEYPNGQTLRLLCDYVTPTPKRFVQACCSGSVSLIAHMLQQGMDANGDESEEESPLQAAARHLRPDAVRLLIHKGVELRSKPYQAGKALLAALSACAAPLLPESKHQMPRFFSQKPPSFNRRPRRLGISPIGFRRVEQCTDIIQVLLQNGASVDAAEGDFGNPLHLACLIGSTVMVQLLLDHGSRIDDVGGYYQTSLFAAMHGGIPEVESLILNRGIDVNYVHQEFGTPLHFACERENRALVRKLLQHGASVAIPNQDGKTVLTLAFESPISPFGDDHFSEIIQRGLQSMAISDSDLLAAAKNQTTRTLESLLEARKNERVSEDLIVRFLTEKSLTFPGNLKLLFERSGSAITERMLMAGLPNLTLAELLQMGHLACKISPVILESQIDVRSMELLVKHEKDVVITEGVVISALGNGCRSDNESDSKKELAFMEYLWQQNPSLVVTKQMLKAAKSVRNLEFLLQHFGHVQGVLQDVATFICEKDIRYYADQAGMLATLLQFDSGIKLMVLMIEKVMAVGDATHLDAFLAHDPSLPITEKLFLSGFSHLNKWVEESRRMEFANILHRHSKRVVFTQKIRNTVDRAYQKQSDLERKEWFYQLRERDETPEEAKVREQKIDF